MALSRCIPFTLSAVLALGASSCGDPERGTTDAVSETDTDGGRPGRPDVEDSGGGGVPTDTGADGSGADAETDAPDDDAADGAGDGSGATDADAGADTGADAATDPGANTADDTMADGDDAGDDAVACPPAPDAWTGTQATDLDGDPLDVGDRVEVEVALRGTASVPVDIEVVAVNLTIDAATVTLDGSALAGATVTGGRLRATLPSLAAGVVRFEADVVALTDLVTVFASLATEAGACPVPRSRSGAILQVIGGESKTPACIDMRNARSVQVAPEVALQNTAAYAAANGRRTDLRAQNFIFCPQSPTIVHTAEFCLERDPGQDVTLAGTWSADGSWEVDDFVLVEVFARGARLDDGFTSQHHNGGSTFWCGEIASLLCTEGCTAELVEIAGSRQIEAQGGAARRHEDGAVSIGALLPADGSRADVRITALDQGVEGTLRPGLWLVSDPVE